MKLFLRSLLVVAFVGLFGSASAQWQLGFNGVIGFPASNADAYNTIFGGTINARYALGDHSRVGLNAGFLSFSAKDVTGGLIKPELSWIPVTATFEYSFTTEGFQPYIGADAGLAFTTGKVSSTIPGLGTISTDVSGSEFILGPVVGFRYGLSDGLDLDFNVKYLTSLESGGAGLIPIGLGLIWKLN